MIEQMDQELKIIFINILRENQMHIQQQKWKGFNEDTVYANGGGDKGTKKIVNNRKLLPRAKVDTETIKIYLAMQKVITMPKPEAIKVRNDY